MERSHCLENLTEVLKNHKLSAEFWLEAGREFLNLWEKIFVAGDAFI